ncbi:hypothetical protein B0H17DRAFT_1067551 [Mycena rosella]|uniref:F-box domain-containing protein n=1 Tax=Mycena rosella TaxID=1033263 RepID=A0AAD7DGJ6_MYCRO|nr:hypothetical protein B0H17DRAFT_1067551 [Mycena rosella]
MCITDLEARIDAFSVEIERQKEVLTKLEHSRSLLQRQLNAVRDQVARLPSELSSDIFLQCLPSRSQPGAPYPPMILLNICNAWREIAIFTPALWASIHIDFPRAKGFGKLLAIWLERAGKHPLSISLHRTFDDDITTVVRRHTQQIKRLELYSAAQTCLDLPMNMGSIPSLETLKLGPQSVVDERWRFCAVLLTLWTALWMDFPWIPNT